MSNIGGRRPGDCRDALATEQARRNGAGGGDGQWGCEFDYTAGLFGAPNRQHAVWQMEARLAAADQPVTGQKSGRARAVTLRTLSELQHLR